jgi:hypothetical protein
MVVIEDRADAATPAAASSAMSFARTVAAGAIGGAVVGLLVGGVVGRLVMRLLALTSGPSVQRLMTDDQFPVGVPTVAGTANLLLATATLGALAGLVYLWVRRVLPPERGARSALFALFTGAIGGAFLVHDHASFDYAKLQPQWLSVLAFVAIPALAGALAPVVIDRLDAPGEWARRGPAWLVLGSALLVLNVGLLLVAVPVLIAFGLSRIRGFRRRWASPVITTVGLVLFALLVVWGLYGLATDILSLVAEEPSRAPFTV